MGAVLHGQHALEVRRRRQGAGLPAGYPRRLGAALLAQARTAGLALELDGGRLRVVGGTDATGGLVARLRLHRDELLEALAAEAGGLARLRSLLERECAAELHQVRQAGPVEPAVVTPAGLAGADAQPSNVVLGPDGFPCEPCDRCGGNGFWRRPAWMGGVTWHCHACEPLDPAELRDAAVLPSLPAPGGVQ